jgi:hypothetical protein
MKVDLTLHFKPKHQTQGQAGKHYYDSIHPSIRSSKGRRRNDLLVLSNSHLNLDTRVNVDGSDLTNNVGRGLKIDQTLVDAHLKAIPGVGTLTARGLTGGDTKSLGRKTDRSGMDEVLLLGTTNEIGAYLLKSLDLTRSQSDTNVMNLRFITTLESFLVHV